MLLMQTKWFPRMDVSFAKTKRVCYNAFDLHMQIRENKEKGE